MQGRNHLIALAMLALSASLVAACGGSSSSSGSTSAGSTAGQWTTPEQALDALKAAGFQCMKDSTKKPSIESGKDADGNELPNFKVIYCDDFGVTVAKAADVEQLDKDYCPKFTTEDWTGFQTRKTVGNDYFFIAAETWPEAAQPEDFAKAFNAKVETVAEYMDRIGCKPPA